MKYFKQKIPVILLLHVLILQLGSALSAQNNNNDLPVFGAQLFIEPGQTTEDIDTWFRMLKENGMKTTRIRMFESYIHQTDGTWDYRLFDQVFQLADKYNIQVYATLFPHTEKTDIGGFKFPADDEHLKSISNYIGKVVTHFSRFKSLHGWVLMNEPGVGGKIPWTAFTKAKYQDWLKQNPPREFDDSGYPILVELTDQDFLLDYTTWFLNWIAGEIRKYDTSHILHVNNHAIFENCAEYNFPEWRKFLTSLGGSAHPSWHFNYFNRNQYAVAMTANCEIIRSGAGKLPWIMTEIQGGNNTYSGFSPFCPTKNEIAQWMWITIGTQGKGGIFWSLNPRASGIEAGEWAMLDFQDQPSERLVAAREVQKAVDAHPALFSHAYEVNSEVNLLYIRQSLWAEKKMAMPSLQNYEGRLAGAVMKSVLGYFETLLEMGLNCNLSEFGEFDFTKSNYSGVVIILANQISIPNEYASRLEQFVSKGGKLIVEGLTGFFDENLHNTLGTGFPFVKLLGGEISEFKTVDNIFRIRIGQDSIPAHLWQGFIRNKSADVLSVADNKPVATSNHYGEGKTVWIPSLLGLGARLGGNEQLARFLAVELKTNIEKAPIRFSSQEKGLLMRTLQSGNELISIVINKSNEHRNVALKLLQPKSPVLLFANGKGTVLENTISISAEETLVIKWQ